MEIKNRLNFPRLARDDRERDQIFDRKRNSLKSVN